MKQPHQISGRYRLLLSVVIISVCGLIAWSLLRERGSPSRPLSIEAFPANISESLRKEIELRLTRLEKNSTPSSWGSLGELCVAQGLLTQAEVCFQNASSMAPENPKWIYHLAVMQEKIDLARAIELYDRVLSLDRTVATVHFRRGVASARVGRFEDAERSLKMALEMTQKHPSVLKAMSQVRMMQGDGPKSLELMLEASHDKRAGRDIVDEAKRLWQRQSPKVEMDSALLADSNEHRPPFTTPPEEPWMDEVAERASKSKEVGLQAGELESQNQFQAAREMYGQLMKMQEQNSRAHTAHAMVLFKAGNARQALEEMKRVCSEFPKDPLVFTSRGTIEAQLEDIPSAIMSFEEAVRLKPDFVDAHRALLLLYQIQKVNDKIEQQFKTLLSLAPADAELQRQYADFQKSPERNQQ